MNSITKRLQRLEIAVCIPPDEIIDVIKNGFYDNLTETQQALYAEYHGYHKETFDAVFTAIYGDLHQPLEYKKPPATAKELEERKREMAELIEEWDAEYNSEDAKAERDRQYHEILRVGECRQLAILKGEPVENYPLPWEKKRRV